MICTMRLRSVIAVRTTTCCVAVDCDVGSRLPSRSSERSARRASASGCRPIFSRCVAFTRCQRSIHRSRRWFVCSCATIEYRKSHTSNACQYLRRVLVDEPLDDETLVALAGCVDLIDGLSRASIVVAPSTSANEFEPKASTATPSAAPIQTPANVAAPSLVTSFSMSFLFHPDVSFSFAQSLRAVLRLGRRLARFGVASRDIDRTLAAMSTLELATFCADERALRRATAQAASALVLRELRLVGTVVNAHVIAAVSRIPLVSFHLYSHNFSPSLPKTIETALAAHWMRFELVVLRRRLAQYAQTSRVTSLVVGADVVQLGNVTLPRSINSGQQSFTSRRCLEL